MNLELSLYLKEALEKFDLNDEEKVELMEYVAFINSSLTPIYNVIDDDRQKEQFLAQIAEYFTKENKDV